MRKLYIITLLIILFMFLLGCENKNENSNNISENNELIDENQDQEDIDYSEDNNNLKTLLPNKENYKWIYNGTAEYGHELTLNSITNLKDSIIYSLDGKVMDVSNDEGKRDLDIRLLYTIKNGKLIQSKDEERMLDSKFDGIIIIKTPLEEGNTWKQQVIDKEGKKVTLNCEIISKEEKNDTAIYKVRYEDDKSDYYEERTIKENMGVVKFLRYINLNEEAFDMGYSIYEKASGYLSKLQLNNYLPPLNKNIMYHGLGEYAYMGVLTKQRDKEIGEYLFEGEFRDGSGLGGEFKIIYTLDYDKGIVIERVIKNTRNDKLKINSIIPNLTILKLPINIGNSWNQSVNINNIEYTINASIIDIFHKNLSYYSPEITSGKEPIVKVRYLIKGIEGYFNDTYIEEREFQANKGIISFSNLMKGDIEISGKELNDELKVNNQIINNMFGYRLSFIE